MTTRQKVEGVFKEHESKGIDIDQEDIELNYKKRTKSCRCHNK